jgi:SAM-dependent methyltransferase
MSENPELHIGGMERLSNVTIPSTHPDFLVYASYHPALKLAISRYVKGKVLDIGCGNKPYHDWIMQVADEHIGCDIVHSSLGKADIICSSDNIPVLGGTFDATICTQVIEHVEDAEGLVREAFRCLRAGGYFVLSGPMYWRLHEEPYDFRRYTKYGFRQLVENAGFRLVSMQENGGKWSVVGQALVHALTDDLHKFKGLKAKIFRRLLRYCGGLASISHFFLKLDKQYYDPVDTLNYVVVAQKPETDAA